MLSEPLDLGSIDATKIFEHLYGFFYRDFIQKSTYLNKTIYVNPQRYRKEDGKEKIFWHLTSREQKYTVKVGNRYEVQKERLPDFDRASRIEWVRPIIQNHTHSRITYFFHQETNPKKDIRLYLWAENDDFVVILQKLGKSSSFMVTTFYIDQDKKRQEFRKRAEYYRTGALKKYEWF